jgi:putative sigma-54 modulation protein
VKIAITGRHVEITPGLREFIEKKIGKIEEFYAGAKEVHVVLTVEKYRHTAEITFKGGHRQLAAKKTTKDMYASVEEVLQAVAHQASRLKEKQKSQSSRRHLGKVAKSAE